MTFLYGLHLCVACRMKHLHRNSLYDVLFFLFFTILCTEFFEISICPFFCLGFWCGKFSQGCPISGFPTPSVPLSRTLHITVLKAVGLKAPIDAAVRLKIEGRRRRQPPPLHVAPPPAHWGASIFARRPRVVLGVVTWGTCAQGGYTPPERNCGLHKAWSCVTSPPLWNLTPP